MKRSGGSANADPIAGFFDGLGKRGHEPLLEKAKGTMRFDLVAGKQVDSWFVAVDNGDVAVSRRKTGADCVVRADRRLFEEITVGSKNAMAALLRGEFAIEGEIPLLAAFQRLLPGPQSSRDPRRAAGDARRQ